MAGPPDPSVPDVFDTRIRTLIQEVLSDPLSYPDQMTNWIQGFVTLNSIDPPTTSVSANP